jgi:hypothetical protein
MNMIMSCVAVFLVVHGNCCTKDMACPELLTNYLLIVTKNTSSTAQMAVAAATSNPAMPPWLKPAAASRLQAASMARAKSQ